MHDLALVLWCLRLSYLVELVPQDLSTFSCVFHTCLVVSRISSSDMFPEQRVKSPDKSWLWYPLLPSLSMYEESSVTRLCALSLEWSCYIEECVVWNVLKVIVQTSCLDVESSHVPVENWSLSDDFLSDPGGVTDLLPSFSLLICCFRGRKLSPQVGGDVAKMPSKAYRPFSRSSAVRILGEREWGVCFYYYWTSSIIIKEIINKRTQSAWHYLIVDWVEYSTA